MLKYKQIWHGIKPTKWLIKINLTGRIPDKFTVLEEPKEEQSLTFFLNFIQ